MTQSVTESSISPGPLSPFSTYSAASGITSDGERSLQLCISCALDPRLHPDAPDLGAFGPVFRALTNLHTRGQANGGDARSATPTSSFALSHSDDSDPPQGPSLWTSRRVTSYLTSSLPGSPVRGRSSLPPDSEGTASEYDDGTELEVPIEDENTMDRPSLGYLDQALTYLAAEREKLAARRELRGNSSTTSDSPSQLLVPAVRRKRRRKRTRSARRGGPEDGTHTETTAGGVDGVDEASADIEDGDTSSSSLDVSSSSPYSKTTPATPAVFRKERQKTRASAEQNPRLHHSRSTPSLHVSTKSFDARTIQLRTLAHKLRLLFPSEAKALSAILSRDFTSSLTYADPRGPVPQSQDTLIHVFIDQYVYHPCLLPPITYSSHALLAQTFLSASSRMSGSICNTLCARSSRHTSPTRHLHLSSSVDAP